MELFSLAVAVFALLLFVVGEVVRRPKLAIERGEWHDPEVPWQFAAVRVTNRRLGRPWCWLFGRSAAIDCQASLTFSREGATIGPIPARWSARPEPIRSEPGGGGVFDPALVPDSYRLTLPATEQLEEVAVAIGNQGRCSAFSAESYAYPDWHRPEWRLEPGRWNVEVIATSADGANACAVFSLTVGTNGEPRWTVPGPSGISRAELQATLPGIGPGLVALVAALLTFSWATSQHHVDPGFYDTANQGALVLLLALVIEVRLFSARRMLDIARIWGRGYVLLSVGLLLLAITGALFSFYGASQSAPPLWIFRVVAPCLSGLLAGIAVAAVLLPAERP